MIDLFERLPFDVLNEIFSYIKHYDYEEYKYLLGVEPVNITFLLKNLAKTNKFFNKSVITFFENRKEIVITKKEDLIELNKFHYNLFKKCRLRNEHDFLVGFHHIHHTKEYNNNWDKSNLDDSVKYHYLNKYDYFFDYNCYINHMNKNVKNFGLFKWMLMRLPCRPNVLCLNNEYIFNDNFIQDFTDMSYEFTHGINHFKLYLKLGFKIDNFCDSFRESEQMDESYEDLCFLTVILLMKKIDLFDNDKIKEIIKDKVDMNYDELIEKIRLMVYIHTFGQSCSCVISKFMKFGEIKNSLISYHKTMLDYNYQV